MAVGERNVREEIRNCICVCAVTADVGKLRNNMVKLTGWNGLTMDTNVTDLWNPIIKRLIFRMGYV